MKYIEIVSIIMMTIMTTTKGDTTLVVAKFPDGVFDPNHCTRGKLASISDDCRKALNDQSSDANILACKLVSKESPLPLGTFDKSVFLQTPLGQLKAGDVHTDVFDKCALPNLIQEGSISLQQVTGSDTLTNNSVNFIQGTLGAEQHIESSFLQDNQYEKIEYADGIAKVQTKVSMMSTQGNQYMDGNVLHRYLYRDYKIVINRSALAKYLHKSVAHAITTVAQKLHESTCPDFCTGEEIDILPTVHNLNNYGVFIPNEFYMERGLAISLDIRWLTPQADQANSALNACRRFDANSTAASVLADSQNWACSNIRIGANATDMLYGGCTLDGLSASYTVSDAIDDCRKSEINPVELDITSAANFVSLWDLAVEGGAFKSYEDQAWKLRNTVLDYYTFCECKSGAIKCLGALSKTKPGRSMPPKYCDGGSKFRNSGAWYIDMLDAYGI